MGVNNSPPILIHPTQDKAQMASYINENFRKISDGFNPFQMSDGTNNIINIGKDSVGNYTMKVAKPGNNAYDAADADLIFNSNQNTFKIVKILTGNIPTGSLTSNNTQVQTNLVIPVAHGVDHIPAFLAYVQLSGATYCLMPYTATDIAGSTINNYFVRSYSITADATYCYVFLQVTQVSTSNVTLNYGGEPFKIYILQESAA